MRSWLKECSVKEMTSLDAAWLSGFFDGEGTVGRWKCGGRSKLYWTSSLQVPNTHLPSLKRCARLTGVGTIQVKLQKGAQKPNWCWRVTRQRDIVDILRQMLPYLVTKKKDAKAFLKTWKDI